MGNEEGTTGANEDGATGPPRRSVFGYLLRVLLPAPFHRAYRVELMLTFRAVMAEARQTGWQAGIRVWLRCVCGLVGVAWRERSDALWDRLSLTNRIARRMMRPRQEAGTMHRVFSDAKLAVRSFRKRPAFTLSALFLLALGIGATTTIFSVVDGVLLRALPYPAVDRLMFFDNPNHSTAAFRAWRDRLQSFDAASAVFESEIDLTGSGDPVRLRGAKVTPGFFPMFGAHPLFGRFFDAAEFIGPPQVAVLGYRLWQDRFGSDSAVLGKTIVLNGLPTVVVGVVEARFLIPEAMADRRTEVYVPFDVATPEYADPGYHILTVVGRIRRSVSLGSAQSELDVLAQTLAREYPKAFTQRNGKPQEMSITTLEDATVGGVGGPLSMLLGAVGLLLLIAVANVANLFLARGTDRLREMALRTALGADRRRLVGQLMTESVLLASVGGLLGLGVAAIGVRAFAVLNPGDIPMIDRIALDLRVLAFAFAIAGITGVLFGLAPAWQSAQVDVNESLKDASSGGIGARRHGTLRNALIIAEVAVALILLAGAGLLFNSFLRLQSVDPGFESERIAILPLVLDDQRYDQEARGRFTEQLLERVQAVPTVRRAALGVTYPFQFLGDDRCCWRASHFATDGMARTDLQALIQPVSPDYFALLGARLRGREFQAADRNQSALPAVVTEGYGQKLFQGDDPLGRVFLWGDSEVQVIGVVAGMHQWGLSDSEDDQIFVPYAELGTDFRRVVMLVKTDGDPSALFPGLRRIVWDLDPDLPIGEMFTMGQRIGTSLAGPRFYAALLISFASVALLLAAGGIYGSMLYSVGQRRRELGIRMALGASRGRVVVSVVRQGAVLTGSGLVIGLAGAYALTRTLESMVYGIGTTDPVTFVAVATVLAAVAVGATLGPARRAAEADPVEALRME